MTGRRLFFLVTGLLLALGVVFSLGTGAVALSPRQILLALARVLWPWSRVQEEGTVGAIVWGVRAPRILLALVTGGVLAGVGAVYQTLFHNPMADPYVVGISAGASLGATVSLVFFPGMWSTPVAALVGALAASFLIQRLSQAVQENDVSTLLLAGLTISAFLGAVVSLLMLIGQRQIGEVFFWLMGGLAGRGWEAVLMALPGVLLGMSILWRYTTEMNLLAMGEEPALHLGVEVGKVQRHLLLGSSLATAAVVSVTGLIGFVGLVVPNLARLLVGPDHRYLLPASVMAGALLLLLADTLARTVIAPGEIPVGAVTAFLGSPFFLYLLLRQRRT